MISGNDQFGIYLVESPQTVITGNLIGVGEDGSTPLGNGTDGIALRDSPLSIIGGDSVPKRNVISDNRRGGVDVLRSDDVEISGNFIGTDAAGAIGIGNAESGVVIWDSTNTLVGGTTPGAGNLISGHESGIYVDGPNANQVTIQGNRIGTNADGDSAIANENGILIEDSSGVLVGGSQPGAGNLISGNTVRGIQVSYGSNNTIEGNFIGTNADGDAALPNAGGIEFFRSIENRIARNLVSGNSIQGIQLRTGANDNLIQGNKVGTDVTGSLSVPNTVMGFDVIAGALGNIIGSDGDGVNDDQEGNLISGNTGHGIHIRSQDQGDPANNVIAGNLIGVDVTGAVPLANDYGIRVWGGLRTRIDANVISGNDQFGIYLVESSQTFVTGNLIGLGQDGMTPLGNGLDGIGMADSPLTIIGGTAVAQRNVISGNHRGGVGVRRSDDVQVIGNFIGVAADGVTDTGNAREGIVVHVSSTNTIMGNVISGNESYGVLLNGAANNQVQNNLIGTNSRGDSPTPNSIGLSIQDAGGNTVSGNTISGNSERGVYLSGPTSPGNLFVDNTIGLSADGTTTVGNGTGVLISGAPDNVFRSNVISGNVGVGVYVTGGAATNNLVEENFVGTDASGSIGLGNGGSGITLADVRGNTVRRNVISDNGDSGVFVVGGSASSDLTNLIEENFIGTDATGTRDLGNTLMGIRVSSGFGPVLRGNVVSGNDNANIQIDATASGVLIENNVVGTDSSGSAPLVALQGFGTSGIVIVGRDNTVRGNVISANPVDGLTIDGLNVADGLASGNLVQDNLIGVGFDGVTPLGNGRYGVRIWRGASNNTVGTDGDGGGDETEGNTIANNADAGVLVLDATSLGNTIRRNAISDNGGLGIDLGGDGVTINDLGDGDSGAGGLQNFPTIDSVRRRDGELRVRGRINSTPSTSFVIDLYANAQADPSGFGEAERWLQSIDVITGPSGDARFDVVVDASLATVGEWITTTATERVTGNTSELSPAASIRGEGVPIGGLVINEIMANPAAVSDAAGEWFELFNPTDQAIQLQGLIIEDASGTRHVITDRVSVPAGGYRVLGNNGRRSANGDVRVDYVYPRHHAVLTRAGHCG